MTDEVFDEHLQTPEHKSKVENHTGETIDNFLSAMRRYGVAYFVESLMLENVIPRYSPIILNLYY